MRGRASSWCGSPGAHAPNALPRPLAPLRPSHPRYSRSATRARRPGARRARAGSLTMPPIDVVIPVHGAAAATRRCVDGVLAARSQRPFEVIVVDDASPDAELSAYLRGLAKEGRITLLEERESRGYAAAVNRALALHDDRDVVVLQSDAVVSNDWLDRLAYHAHREARVGAVAPFCSSSGIANYPRLAQQNPLPDAATVSAYD